MMKFFQVKSLEETFDIIHSNVSPISRIETLPLIDSLGRVLAEDISVSVNIPAFTRSSVDGYAVIASDTFGSSESIPGFLTLKGSVAMGDDASSVSISQGEAVYVPTGGMLPVGANAMLMIEYAEVTDDLICVYRQVAPMENVVQPGEDFAKGSVIAKSGTVLRSQDLGALASNGISEVRVFVKPVVTYLSTGDEIVNYDTNPLPIGKIRSSNNVTVGAMLREMGCEYIDGGIVPDVKEQLELAVKEAMANSDCVIMSGGSSVGEKDFTMEVIDAMGDPGVLLHGVSMKPGKPTILGVANGKPVIGLPGHPAAAMVVFRVIGNQVIQKLCGASDSQENILFAKTAKNIESSVGRTDFIRVKLTDSGDHFVAEPVHGKSGLLSTLVDSAGLLEIPAGKEGIEKGEFVKVLKI